MTSKRDLKRRVRDRQARTGERYTTALARVKGKQESSAIPVVEMVDLGEVAARLGLKCRVLMTPDLPRACGELAVEKLRDALHATQEDPATRHFRAVALAGERRRPHADWPQGVIEEGRRFMARARAGIGGVSDGGSMLALAVPVKGGVENVVFILWMMNVPVVPPAVGSLFAGPWDRDPMILLTTPGGIQRVFQFPMGAR
jgi:hypothetical protein